jgi:hypothetical protein
MSRARGLARQPFLQKNHAFGIFTPNREKALQKFISLVLVLFGAAIVALLALLAYQNERTNAAPELTTPFHGVLLINGQVYFGRLEHTGSRFPVLREVFFVRSQPDPEPKQVVNTLVKRGQEAHAPDRMILNAAHILQIEPVKPDSQVGKLIEANRQGAIDAAK